MLTGYGSLRIREDRIEEDGEEKLELEKREAPIDVNGESISNVPMEAELKACPPAVSAKRLGGYSVVKRCFDIVLSFICLIVLSPVFLIIAILVHQEDHGPIIHRRCCASATGTYNMLKFRTMVVDAGNLKKYLTPDQIKEYHTNIKLKNDPRITKIGHVLRKTSLDELPQLWNIFRGEMSFVGPRPVVQEELEYFGDNGALLLTAKPGITGYWQVHGRSESTYESGERQRLELYYVEHRSLWMDARILLRTIPVVLSTRGGY